MSIHSIVSVQGKPVITYDPATGLYRAGAPFFWGALSCTTGQFLPPGIVGINASTNSNRNLASWTANRPCTITNLMAMGGSTGGIATLWIDGVATTLTVTSVANYTPAYDYTHLVDVAAGQQIALKLTGTISADWNAAFDIF